MKKSYILSLFAAMLLATGCSQENPFDGFGSGSEGQFLKSALSVGIDAAGIDVSTTRAIEADIDDFTILFNSESLDQPVKYKYAEMPEIVTLPAGKYTVTATYGENRDAAWENPHFLGSSEEFEVNPMEITSYIDPILCRLENIKVTIDFDDLLREHMSADSYVEVKVGDASSLIYGIPEADAEKAGYFKHTEEISLVAVFNGVVDGSKISETKSMKDIEKGNHYKITFKLHQGSDSDFSGNPDIDFDIDATVSVVNVNTNVPLIEDKALDDNERPTEDDPKGDDDNKDPSNPDIPAADAPTITAEAPVNLDAVNNGNGMTTCVLYIDSKHEDGIIELYCDIDSPSLTQETLQEINLDTRLDLVNTPEEMQEGFQTLNLPYLVGHQKHVVFDISRFISILGGVSEPGSLHKFTLTVKDANGTCSRTLQIKY